MDRSGLFQDRRFPLSFSCTMLSLFAFSLSLLIGVACGEILYTYTADTLSVTTAAPYAGCDLFPEYCARAAQLCQSTVFQLALVWLSAYVRFDKILLAAVFASRGCAFGMAFRLCALLQAEHAAVLYTAAYACITVVFLMLVFHLRTDKEVRPIADSFTAMMIAGGVCCAIVILSTFLL